MTKSWTRRFLFRTRMNTPLTPVPRRATGLAQPTELMSDCRENIAQIRQSRPNFGLGLQAKVLKNVEAVPSSLAGETLNPDQGSRS
jgi:hypothetical protein